MRLIKTKQEVTNISFAGKVVAQILATLSKMLVPGCNGLILSKKAKAIMLENNCQPSFFGYYGFPDVICVSVNEQLVHGIPNDLTFQTGDLVSIDVGCQYQGYHADAALTQVVGKTLNCNDSLLLTRTEAVLQKVVEKLKPGMKVGDIGYMIEQVAFSYGYSVPLNYAGHGIGAQLHEEPTIFNFGQKNTGLSLKPGMVVCIEPMFLLGRNETETLDDGWTVVAIDGKRNCHFEHTILITKKGCQVLTDYKIYLDQ